MNVKFFLLVGAALALILFLVSGRQRSHEPVASTEPKLKQIELNTKEVALEIMPGKEPVVAYSTLKENAESLPAQRTLRFNSVEEMNRFLAALKRKGISPKGVIPALRTLRMAGLSDEQLGQLLEGFSLEEIGLNYRVRLPDSSDSLTKNEQVPLLPFDQEWFKALGISSIGADWGKGVVVAIVDSGVEAHDTLKTVSIQRINVGDSAPLSASEKVNGHGTAVASLIAGQDPRLAGLAPKSRLLSLNVFNEQGESDAFLVAEAIVQAVDAGANIINLSLGSAGDSPVLRDAVTYALQRGVALVAASGNEGVGQIAYPARYPGVLAVGSTDATTRPTYFSNYGPELGIVAPGVSLPAGWSGNQAKNFSGTSASTAVASSALAMLISQNPGVTPLQALSLMQKYADDWGAPGRDTQAGFGMPNINRIMERNTPGIFDGAITSQWVASTDERDGSVSIAVAVQNRGTETLWNPVLNIQANSYQQNFVIPTLAQGQSYLQRITIYPSQLNSGKALISSKLQLSGITDRAMGNNVMQSQLRVGR